MTFHEAMELVEYRFAFPEPAHFHNLRTAWLLERTGLRSAPRVVVAGSMGKASTARLLGFVLRALGKRVVLGTKPPLLETHEGNLERYQILEGNTARWLESERFAAYVEELEPHLNALPPELGPWAPYDLRAWVLARASVGSDWLIQEANIGLRVDPVRAFPAPELVMLTPIGEEHYDILRAPEGELERLGRRAGPVWHKAGGVWPGVRTVLGRQRPDVEAACVSLIDGPVLRFGHDFGAEVAECDLTGSFGRLWFADQSLPVRLRVLGRFQLDNAAVAAAAAWSLYPEPSTLDAIVRGLALADSPGRLEPWGDGTPPTLFAVDGGTTKMAAAVGALEELVPANGTWVGVGTVMQRLPAPRETLSALLASPRLRAFVATDYQGDASSPDVPCAQVAVWAREIRPDVEVVANDDPRAALAQARAMAGPDELVLAIGPGLGQALSLERHRGQQDPGST